MKKKKLASLETPNRDIDLKSIIHQHSLFFDKLIELIPAKFYIPNEDKDNKPWYQGLSKSAKASAKKIFKENIKKSRKDRLDPVKASTTTLDLLKQSLEFEKTDSKKCDIENEAEIKQISGFEGEDRSVTYEELRLRLRRRIEELRGNRNCGEKPMNERREKRELEQRKRKRSEDDKKAGVRNVVHKSEKDVSEASQGLEFNKVKIGDEEENGKKKKRKISKAKELEKAKKLVEAKNDPERGDIVSKKHSWRAAVSRAAGAKVHDDPKLLRQTMKKEKKRHDKNAEKWKERVETREKLKAQKQQTRGENIAERIHQKKMRKIAKREKKLMRPGFEGRKEGFVNE